MATLFSHPISARNQISGKVAAITSGSTMTLVTVSAHGHRFVAAMTNEEALELGVNTHDNVLALIESTQTMLVKGDATQMQISACNRLVGHVSHLRKDHATGSVTVTTESGKVTATIGREGLEEMEIQDGEQVTALFKATDVTLQKS
jgi:molybdate transport system regulatory protein